MIRSIAADYRPSFLRKSYPREAFPVDGPNGAHAIFQQFGLPDYMGKPTDAIAFRDQTGWVRSICALFPEFGSILELRICRHVSHIGEDLFRTFPTHRLWWQHNMRRSAMSKRAREYRGEDL